MNYTTVCVVCMMKVLVKLMAREEKVWVFFFVIEDESKSSKIQREKRSGRDEL